MKERPILFSPPMVRAILDARKTQTRRMVKPQPQGFWDAPSAHPNEGLNAIIRDESGHARDKWIRCRYGAVGDRLWVRETWREREPDQDCYSLEFRADRPEYKTRDDDPSATPWRPSIHMPRAASRITLEVTGVRVERLQGISQADVFAEGVQLPCDAETKKPLLQVTGDASPLPFLPKDYTGEQFVRAHYAALWASINGAESWAANPWVWVIEFKRVPQ